MRRVVSLCLTMAGFGLTFAFYLWPMDELRDCYIVFRPDVVLDAYSHVYYLAERIFIAILCFQIWLFDRGVSSFVTFVLFALYVLDYWLFYNDPIPGTKISFAMFMAGCFLIMILREFYILIWKQR